MIQTSAIPWIRELRYPVEVMLELLMAGMTIDEILADYDDLEPADLYAALVFATRLKSIETPSSSISSGTEIVS